MTSSTKITFSGSSGDTLAGRLDLPDGKPLAYALFAHCFTCSKDVLASSRIARSLAEAGIAVLRFDFTGLGHSEGEFSNTNFSSNIDDLIRAAGHLREHYAAPSILIGHSLGGAAVLAAAHRLPEVKAVAVLGAPADPEHVTRLLGDARTDIEQEGEAEVSIAGRRFRIRSEFLQDIGTQPQAERIANLNAALLVLHSPTDEIVSVDNARLIFDAARHPRSFVSLDGADHLLTDPADAAYAATVIAAWAGRYVDLAADADGAGTVDTPSAEAPEAPVEGVVRVAESGAGPYAQRVTVGTHVLAADEPRPTGNDTGPSPYDLLLAGLGACTAMTLRMYADRKEWALQHVAVSLRHSRIYARDCESCETEQGKIDRIERSIEIDGDLDEDQRQRLLAIADKCPVHRTLHSETVIDTTEAGIAAG
ncbi:bifunctional alpha/beta hydrolase/OsmC family protein [Haloechinothrix sp. LS1_15]|uniref:bifunctional alpha/beta hydrolase/OsmC family protein n=1 Tax=Haloechinothrix sp. LS1_15 TaxID=2652248 RepID=UPI00294783E7|nr:bifunctional alpha/beta hydrolase/OsmC family protein [Haloechinothrix sp. LS1_15]MDV6013601.1 OsmC family protein [Haloechinothrix sp. LS1_15]